MLSFSYSSDGRKRQPNNGINRSRRSEFCMVPASAVRRPGYAGRYTNAIEIEGDEGES